MCKPYFLFLQAGDPALAVDSLSAIAPSSDLNLLDLTLKGGFFMIPLFILSLVAVYIFAERYQAIRKVRGDNQSFMNMVRDFMSGGNLNAALSLCQRTDHPLARMIGKGVQRVGRPLKDIETSIETVGKLEVAQLEKNLGTLATIASVAPMVGFLGTVTGMIRAFFNMSQAGNNINPSVLAGGIYEAMVTTAAGLIIGIMAYVGYNYLVAMMEKVVNQLEIRSVEFLDLLHEPDQA